jgi:hypothetical protein
MSDWLPASLACGACLAAAWWVLWGCKSRRGRCAGVAYLAGAYCCRIPSLFIDWQQGFPAEGPPPGAVSEAVVFLLAPVLTPAMLVAESALAFAFGVHPERFSPLVTFVVVASGVYCFCQRRRQAPLEGACLVRTTARSVAPGTTDRPGRPQVTKVLRTVRGALALGLVTGLLASGWLLGAAWTRQIVVRSSCPDALGVGEVRGRNTLTLGAVGSGRRRLLWPEKGRYYIEVRPPGGSGFVVHYFHADTGVRRRVSIEIGAGETEGEVQVELRYGQDFVRSCRFLLSAHLGGTLDLMGPLRGAQATWVTEPVPDAAVPEEEPGLDP